MAIHGFLIFLIGPLASWVSSFMTYGLGELIENSDILVENSDILVENSRASIDNGKLTFVKATPKSVVPPRATPSFHQGFREAPQR